MFTENCGDHLAKVVSLPQYQKMLEEQMSQHISNLQGKEVELMTQIQSLDEDSRILATKKQQDQETKETISKFHREIQEILKLESNEKNMFLSSSKLEQLIKIEKEFNDRFVEIPNERNEKVQEVEAEKKELLAKLEIN